VIDGVTLSFAIRSLGGKRYQVLATGTSADLGLAKNPVPVVLTIGNDKGTKAVRAVITTSPKQ
jgi:hypothetical protein